MRNATFRSHNYSYTGKAVADSAAGNALEYIRPEKLNETLRSDPIPAQYLRRQISQRIACSTKVRETLATIKNE